MTYGECIRGNVGLLDWIEISS